MARQHRDDVDGRIVEYLKDPPQSTTGEYCLAQWAQSGPSAM
jgi:hypothetical protein